jgi:serine/threonine protein kinase
MAKKPQDEDLTVDSTPIVNESDQDATIVLPSSNESTTSANAAKELSLQPKGKYTIEKVVASGGMKAIQKIKDRDTGRDAAMAVILPDIEVENANINRFIQEARITANLEHPNIVPVHDIGVNDSGNPYFVMKLLSGETLASIIFKLSDNNPEYLKIFNLHHRLGIFMKVCNAVAFAHSRRIIHLDLKPENIQVGDFGEVLVLDWGLAKTIGAFEEELPVAKKKKNWKKGKKIESFEISNSSIHDRIGDSTIDVTVDGVIKGTPGYMAPEQVHGKNNEKNERTDIYALGAILYSLLTLERSVEGDNATSMIINAREGNIIPPAKRTPDRLIPKSLEAVAMKSLAFDPKERYQTVAELAYDIDAFISGFATSAEKASFSKHIFLFIKRHKTVALFIFLLTLTLSIFGSYIFAEHQQQWGNWSKIYQDDFTKKNTEMKKLLFFNALNSDSVAPWKINKNGLQMEKMQWLWLKNISIQGDSRLVIKMTCSGSPDALEVCINSKITPLIKEQYVPAGYSFQFGAWSGRGNLISKNTNPQPSSNTNNTSSTFKINTIHELILEKKREKISLTVDGIPSISIVDYFPPTGKEMTRIGMRSFSPSTIIKSIAVYRWALPEKTPPTVAGDTLAEFQYFDAAIKKYLTIAENQQEPEIAAKALLKAYLTASSKEVENHLDIMDEIKKRIEKLYRNSPYHIKILEQEILYFWRMKEYDMVFKLLPELFKIADNSKIMLKILQIQHEHLPDETGQKLLTWIKKSKNIRELNIAGLGLTSLAPLKGMRINAIDCSRNPIKNLNDLTGMPLEKLHCANCGLNSLEALRGMKIKDLIISQNRISNLDPLEGMPLERLRCRLNRIPNLEALKRMPLERLECGGNQIANLEPLKGMPLFFLGCRMNNISSLEPLRGMKLCILDCQQNPIKSIQPLLGMPLRELFINDCPIKDITPIKHDTKLEKLTIPSDCKDIVFLKKLPHLEYLDTKWDLVLQKSSDFWKKHQ